MIGTVINQYRITEKLGEGGMGAVYKGVDTMLEREVAIKALRPELTNQPELVERFRAEAITLAKLNHPNIALVYSFIRHDDQFFMVLEYVRGRTLDRIIQQHGAIPWEQAIALFAQSLEGMEHAHSYGVVHRDIKPANMMLTDAGVIKVMDFGIARVLGANRMTRQGYALGTLQYMSPEQIRGQDTDARSDIYSLGILLYEMITGCVPFSSESEYDLMRKQIEEAPPPPRDLMAAAPPEVETAIMRALAKAPNYRYQTVAEFRRQLLPLVKKDVTQYFRRDTDPNAAALNTNQRNQTPPSGAGSNPSYPVNYQTRASAPPPPSRSGAVTVNLESSSNLTNSGVTPPPSSNVPRTEVYLRNSPPPSRQSTSPQTEVFRGPVMQQTAVFHAPPINPPAPGSRKLIYAIVAPVILLLAGVGAYLAYNSYANSKSPVILPSAGATSTKEPTASSQPVQQPVSNPEPVNNPAPAQPAGGIGENPSNSADQPEGGARAQKPKKDNHKAAESAADRERRRAAAIRALDK